MLKSILKIFILPGLLFLAGFAQAQDFVGSEACAACHQQAYDDWQLSHHRQAMQPATAETVLGDFNNQAFDYFGQVSRFYTRNENYYIETETAAGELEEFRVAYTFGFTPLQQYLLEFPDGRLQAFSIAWDARPADEGGQRWYHLYPEEEIEPDNMLHWSGAFQNWNSRCASCHTTDLQKNYDQATDSYNTQWRESHVGCEGCHGPGSQHVAAASEGNLSADNGFLLDIKKVWEPVAGQLAIPEDNDGLMSQQLQTCAACHSRRAELQHRDMAAAFLDNYSLSPLLPDLYYADGQILDEVYVMGSFLQSRMHQNQVSCTNCHEPHTNQLRIEGNGLCLQCHQAASFQTQQHMFHEADSTGAQCINCHMPETTYMGVDGRRDHSFRIPDPIASLQLDVPNACNNCHQDQSVQWAADFMQARTGSTEPVYAHAGILQAAQNSDESVAPELLALAADVAQTAMIRAAALIASANFPSQRNIRVVIQALNHEDPILRMNALYGLGFLNPQQRLQYVLGLLDDPVKAVRMNVVRQLIGLRPEQVPPNARNNFQNLLTEFEESLQFNADMPEAMNELGLFYAAYGDLDRARLTLEHALNLSVNYLPAMLNLSDLYRALERDDLAEPLLDSALSHYPESADATHSLGLLYVRTFRLPESLQLFQQASALAPDNPQYVFVYAVALAELERADEAIAVLETARQRFPNDVQIRNALEAYRNQ